MTIIERIRQIVASEIDLSEEKPASLEKLVYIAYFMGREEATREVSDKYSAHIAEQHKRADACRYSRMANAVVGPERFIYSGDYACEMTGLFGSDPADI